VLVTSEDDVFNLISQPWIPVLRADGPADVSIRDALHDAPSIIGLATSSALQEAALARLLVAIVLDATGAPKNRRELADRWRAGRFPDDMIEHYLDSVAGGFDLFSPERPFAQVAGLHTASDETKPSSLLIAAEPSGNNVPLFSARTEGHPPALTPAEAARWLLTTHAWDTAAIKSGAVGDPQMRNGKTVGNPTGPLGQLGVVLPVGRTLFETLLLNLPWWSDGLDPHDVPHWRRDGPNTAAWASRQPTGILELLTWQSRRIRLIPTELTDGTVVVERVVVAAGDRLTSTPEYEPHTTWNTAKVTRAGDEPLRPRRHQSGQAAWRGLPALLALEPDVKASVVTSTLIGQIADLEDAGTVLGDGFPLTIHTVGVSYGNQRAVVEDIIADRLPLPVAALREDPGLRVFLGEVAEQSKALHDAANILHADLRRAAGGDPVPWDKSQRPGELVLHRLDGVVRRLLIGLRTDTLDDSLIDQAREAWQRTARRIVVDIVETYLRAAPA